MGAPAEVPLKGRLVLGEAARTGRQQLAQLGNYDRIHDVGAGGARGCRTACVWERCLPFRAPPSFRSR